MDYLSVWSSLLLQPAQIQVALDLPETRTPMCSRSSRLKYNKLLLINMSELSQFAFSSSSRSHVKHERRDGLFLPVPRRGADMFVAFLFVA